MLERDVRRYRPYDSRVVAYRPSDARHGVRFTVGSSCVWGVCLFAGLFSGGREEDESMVAARCALTGMTRIADQNVLTLSGGVLQRTFLAQLLGRTRACCCWTSDNTLTSSTRTGVRAISGGIKTPGRAGCFGGARPELARAYGSRALLLDGRENRGLRPAAEYSRGILNCAYDMDVSAWMNRVSQWRKTKIAALFPKEHRNFPKTAYAAGKVVYNRQNIVKRVLSFFVSGGTDEKSNKRVLSL